jgi:hypothetical protein
MQEKQKRTALKVPSWQRSLAMKGCRFFANNAQAADPVVVDNFVLVAIPDRLFVINEF